MNYDIEKMTAQELIARITKISESLDEITFSEAKELERLLDAWRLIRDVTMTVETLLTPSSPGAHMG